MEQLQDTHRFGGEKPNSFPVDFPSKPNSLASSRFRSAEWLTALRPPWWTSVWAFAPRQALGTVDRGRGGVRVGRGLGAPVTTSFLLLLVRHLLLLVRHLLLLASCYY